MYYCKRFPRTTALARVPPNEFCFRPPSSLLMVLAAIKGLSGPSIPGRIEVAGKPKLVDDREETTENLQTRVTCKRPCLRFSMDSTNQHSLGCYSLECMNYLKSPAPRPTSLKDWSCWRAQHPAAQGKRHDSF